MPVLLPPALGPFLDLLRCPTCHTRRLHPDRGALRCLTGHTFDIARHGYASLLTGTRATSGDDVAMVQARDRFLATGGYAPILQAVTRLAAHAVPERGTVVDVGCGTGYYLAGCSRPSAQRPGSGHGHVGARCARQPEPMKEPLRRPGTSFAHFLSPTRWPTWCWTCSPRAIQPSFTGYSARPAKLIVVRPTDRHLVELRGRVPAMVTIDPAKEQRLHRALDPYFTVTVTEQVEYLMALIGLEALDLVGMTPSARHVNRADLSDDGLLPDQVTVSVLATAYQPR